MSKFFSAVYADEGRRLDRRRGRFMDTVRYCRNAVLSPLESAMVRRYHDERVPIVFLVGAPRTGTTVLYQLMARYLKVGYFNAYSARYWSVPLVGTALCAARLGFNPEDVVLESHLGAGPGAGAPHEFSWFWHYFGDFREGDDLTEDELGRIDWDAIKRHLYGVAGWFGRPLVMKSLNFVDYHIAFLSRRFPSIRFIWIRRDTRFAVQSILQSRRTRYGSEHSWWSVRPRDFRDWLDCDPVEQVAHQVMDLERIIGSAFETLQPRERLVLRYEELVKAPHETLDRVAAFLGVDMRSRDEVESLALPDGNVMRVSDERFRQIERALESVVS